MMKKRRSTKKIILGLVIICFVGSAFSFLAGYNIGFGGGHTEGYGAGLDLGRSHGYNRMDPTYSEMRYFLSRDTTDRNEYIEDEYICRHFAADVCNNAEDENIRCAYVIIGFVEVIHAIVAFDTVDRGLIFIEPQTDEEMDVGIGKPYWPRDDYLPPDYDDTIEEVIVTW